MKKPWYIRGCVTERSSCAEVRKAHNLHTDIVKLISCTECEGDRCNTSGVSRSLPDFLMAFTILIVSPLLTKYTFS